MIDGSFCSPSCCNSLCFSRGVAWLIRLCLWLVLAYFPASPRSYLFLFHFSFFIFHFFHPYFVLVLIFWNRLVQNIRLFSICLSVCVRKRVCPFVLYGDVGESNSDGSLTWFGLCVCGRRLLKVQKYLECMVWRMAAVCVIPCLWRVLRLSRMRGVGEGLQDLRILTWPVLKLCIMALFNFHSMFFFRTCLLSGVYKIEWVLTFTTCGRFASGRGSGEHLTIPLADGNFTKGKTKKIKQKGTNNKRYGR